MQTRENGEVSILGKADTDSIGHDFRVFRKKASHQQRHLYKRIHKYKSLIQISSDN
jgi:hypothetical protein